MRQLRGWREKRSPSSSSSRLQQLQRGADLKGFSASPRGGQGVVGGQGGSICGPAGQHWELHVAGLSMTTRARAGRGLVREHGKAQLRSESARLEQRDENKAPSDFHFSLFVCFILSTDVSPLCFTGNKGASKETQPHTTM